MLQGCAAIQGHLVRLEEWTKGKNSVNANAKSCGWEGIVESWDNRIIKVGWNLSRALVQSPAGNRTSGCTDINIQVMWLGGVGWDGRLFNLTQRV